MKILRKLHIGRHNAGACNGPDSWSHHKGHEITSINPSNEKQIASVYSATANDYDDVLQKAHEAFLTWRMIPAPKRGDIVRQIGEKLRAQKDDLGSLVALEMGKSKQEGDGEVQEMIDMADLVVGQSRMLYGKSMHSERKKHRMYEQWLPLGVVGVITAFNFPVAVWAWNAFVAAICGNTVVWKPSSKTPLCAIAIQHICNEVMKENNLTGIFSILITEDPQIKKQFVDDKRLPLISFTGSSAVGLKINEAVAKRMGRCLLECSGNNAIIVDETADLNLAIPSIVFGAIGTAGQRCTTTRRLITHHSIEKELTDALINAYKKVTIGDPLDTKNLMGPLIDKTAVNHFHQAIQAAKEQGGIILTGGNALEQMGYFVEPTLIKAKNEWPIVQEETFAPILYLLTYETLDEAIAIQNGVCQGLSSALFTTHLKNAEYFLSAQGSDCGIANINIGTSGAEIGGAFGGEKATGGGREAGSDAWKAYMRRQTNTINWSDELPLAQGIKFEVR